MPAPVSVIIPTLNAAANLPATTDALLAGATDGLIRELILSDGGSDEDMTPIAEGLGAALVSGPPGRGGQIKRGVEAAKGEWLLILHADTHLSSGWTTPVLAHLNAYPDQAGYFRLAFRGGGRAARIVASGANLRARFLGLPYGDQGLLISQKLLDEIGGIPDLPLMEDVALARRLRGRLRPLAATAETSPERYEREGWFRRVTYNLGTLARYFLGTPPETLKRRYERR